MKPLKDISDEFVLSLGEKIRQRQFAHKLIDGAAVGLFHGHSSHHVRDIEVYRNKLTLYDCDDFLNDYEGISGYPDLIPVI